MLTQTIKRILRKPVPALALLLFAAVMAAVLCGLHAANQAERAAYEEAYRTIPVTLTVTDLTGKKSDSLEIYPYAVNAFRTPYELGDYLTDMQVKMSISIRAASTGGEPISCTKLIGITALQADSNLAQSADNIITWLDGYDESVLAGRDLVCVIPEKLVSELGGIPDGVTLSFHYETYNIGGTIFQFEDHVCALKVAGTHQASGNIIYCPLSVVETAYSVLEKPKTYDALGATVADNMFLDELRERAAKWFPEPNPTGTKTPWDYAGHSYYPHALVIDDSQLLAAAAAMEDSIRVNNLCTLAVFGLSAAASFFVGFLMVRGRRREIALMRTMGTPRRKIWLSFAFEQMLCVLLGAALGGAVFLWHPIGRLGLFLAVYFAGLALALLIFLHSRLITAVKEAE